MITKIATMSISYMKEATQNLNAALVDLKKNGSVNLACIYCREITNVTNKNNICFIFSERTILCSECFTDCVVPIVEKSILFSMTDEERIAKLNEWHVEGFGYG